MRINEKVIVSSKGQVVIPRSLRQILGIHAGTELVFILQKENTIQIKPVKRSIEQFFGCCKQEKKDILSITGIDQAIEEAVRENDSKSSCEESK